jgi:hypothetical protein
MANEAELLEPPETTQVDTPEVEAPESLRDTLTKAFDEDQQSTPAGTTPPAGVEPPPAQTPATPDKKAAAVDPAAQPGKPTDPKAAPTGPLKAPAQWKPNVREKWNGLPREVQEEILRREGDSMRLIGSVGHKIRLADEVAGHIQPFMETLQTNGVSPSSFMGDVFTTVSTLARGDAQAKAETIANIVQSYGVDVRILDQVLTSRLSAGPEVTEARRLAARAQSVIQERQQETQQRGSAEAERALSAFAADPKHEFLDDVRDLMADLMQAGRAETLEDAYAAAIWAHPDTRKILLERQQQQRAQAKGQRAMAARRASSSVHGTPTNGLAGAQLNPGASLRETLEAAFDEHAP